MSRIEAGQRDLTDVRRRTRGAITRRALILAWMVFLAIVAMTVLPARYTAQTDLHFEIAAQPPAGAVRGIAQVFSSRDMAFAVLDRLTAPELDELSRRRDLLPDWLTGDDPAGRERAAARLMAHLSVTPANGGRTLELRFTSPSPAASAAVLNAYAAAFSHMQDTVVTRRDGDTPALPRLDARSPTQRTIGRDWPEPAALLTLAGMAAALATVSVQLMRASEIRRRGPAPRLPSLSSARPRVAWMDGGRGTALAPHVAAARLAADLAADKGQPDKRLVIVTSDIAGEAAPACAIAIARQLSYESRVALVALDGASGDLAGLISDPWAPGMAEMLFGVAGFGETIHRDPHSRAHVIPPGREHRTGASVISADRLGLILTSLRETYDFVIVAAPVLDPVGGAQTLAQLEPYIVCVDERSSDEASVEPYAALAAQGFSNVLMLRLAPGEPAPGPARLDPLPSLSAA